MAASTVTGLLGSARSGFVSDSFFRSRRNVPVLLFGLAEIAGLLAFFLISAGHRLQGALAMGVFGFAAGGLLASLGGLMAVDLSPQNAAGAAMGVIGLFSYMGAALQNTVSGVLLETDNTTVAGKVTRSFDGAFAFWLSASVLALLLTLRSVARRETSSWSCSPSSCLSAWPVRFGTFGRRWG